MSEFRFFAFTDWEFHSSNRSQNLLNLPISPFQPTRRTTTDEISHELNVPYTVFEILVAICAVIGNLMVIIVFQRERKLRRRTNYYIVSLAMADFLVGSLGVPFAILASIGLPTNLHACLFTVSLLVVLCTISIFCLVAVSVDRYWAILYPMAYSRNVRTKTAIIIISLCWLAGTVVGLLPLFGWHADVGPNQACLFVEVMDYDYLVFLYFATIITPALLMLAFYTHIYRVIVKQVRQIVTMNPVGDCSRRSSTAQIQTSTTSSTRPCHGGTMLRVLGAARKRDVKATQNLSIIVLFFMICWIPLYTINCIKAFCPDCAVHPKLTLFCIILSHLNSAVNPVLYAYHLKDFRAALKNLILKIMGVELEPQIEAIHRFSMASQHRLQSMDANMRNTFHPRIYIDSPIWLRQQQQQSLKNPQLTPKCGVVSPCLNNIHQTVAAVASVTTDIERGMWNIMEASSSAEVAEVNYEFPDIKAQDTPTPPLRHHRPSVTKQTERCDSPYSYDNHNYSTSPEEAEFDEVFLPQQQSQPYSSVDGNALQRSLIACAMHEKLRTDDTEYQSQVHSTQKALIDSSYQSDCEPPLLKLEKQTPPSNGKLPLTITSSPPHSPQQQQKPSKITHQELTDISKPLSRACLPASSGIYIIDTDTSVRSPGHKPRFKKSARLPVNFSKTTKTFSRSCSCTSESASPTKELTNPSAPTTQITRSESNSNSSLCAIGSDIDGDGLGDSSSRSNNNNNSNTTNNLNYYTFHHLHQHHPQNSHTLPFHPEKFSPLRAVSNFIFPPIVKHSSLFQLFQPSAPTSESPPTTTTTIVGASSIDESTLSATATPVEQKPSSLIVPTAES